MKHVTAVLECDDESQVVSVDREVLAAADGIAHLLAIDTRRLSVPPGPASVRAGIVMDALAADDVAAAALSAKGDAPVCWDVIGRVGPPVVVVPRGSEGSMRRISRVLLPMDGAAGTAAGVAHLVRRALGTGASVVAMHVFDPESVPAFWDQAAHSHQEWTREFARRNLPDGVQLDLCSGRPAEEVLAGAERADVDLIIVGWSQDLSGGRAATVRHALDHGRVPVLLVPCGDGDLVQP